MATVTHAFNCAIADDATAAAAGQVLPSHWNAEHTVTLTAADLSGALESYTWAGKPTAVGSTGRRIRISDYGIAPGLVVVSDGTRWMVDGVQVLSRNNAAVSVGAVTTETALATVTIPGGLLGTNGSLRILGLWAVNNSAGTKTPRIRLGGVAGTIYFSSAMTTTAGIQSFQVIRANNSESAQKGQNAAASGATTFNGAVAIGPTTSSVSMATDADLVLTGQKSVAGDTLTLESYTVEILP